jgi:hypothetical protein
MSTVDGGWRGPNIVKDGLVLYLDAGSPNSYYGGTGTVWKDMSGNGNNGTLINGPTFNSANGGSIVFDGTNDYCSIQDISISNQITIDSWVYANSLSSYNAILSQWRANTISLSCFVLETVGSDIRLYIGSGSNLYFASTPFTTGAWRHVVGTYDGTTVRIYLNAVLGLTTDNPPSINNSSLNLNVGALYNSGGTEGSDGLWNGRISQVKYYNRALSATEVLQNFNATRARFGI